MSEDQLTHTEAPTDQSDTSFDDETWKVIQDQEKINRSNPDYAPAPAVQTDNNSGEMSPMMKKAVKAGFGILGVSAIAVGGNAAMPHVEDLTTQDSIVAEGDVTVAQDGNLLGAMQETADKLILDAKVDPSRVNLSSIAERTNESSALLGGTNIQAGMGGTLELVDLGGTYTFEFKPDVQLPMGDAYTDPTETSPESSDSK